MFPRIRALVAPHRGERELDEDLAFHIERETQKHIAAGLSPVERSYPSARALRPGPACRRPVSRRSWHRFVDDLARDILYALRTFRRAPLAALTIIATVALGLGLVTAVFAVYNIFLLRVDAVRGPGELFAVEMEQRIAPDNEPDVVFTRSDYDAMRRETSVFTDAVAMLDADVTRIEGRLARPATACLIAVSVPTLRAARIDPIATLRND